MTIKAIRDAVEAASAQWTGLSWDSALGPMANALTKAIAAAKRRDSLESDDDGFRASDARGDMSHALASARDPAGGTWWPRDGSREAQRLDKRWRDLVSDVEAFDDDSSVDAIGEALAECEALAAEEREHVESRAAQAAEYGAIAAECAEAGDWDGAIEAANDACRTEREFGDSPAWSRVLVLVRENAPSDED